MKEPQARKNVVYQPFLWCPCFAAGPGVSLNILGKDDFLWETEHLASQTPPFRYAWDFWIDEKFQLSVAPLLGYQTPAIL